MHRSTWDYEARLRINQNQFLFAYVNEIFDNIDKKKKNNKEKEKTLYNFNEQLRRNISKDQKGLQLSIDKLKYLYY